MKNQRYTDVMAEVLHYLKGIEEEDYKKIPQDVIEYLEENASKEYICEFDYSKPLSELELLDETKGIIGEICYNYWCQTNEEKEKFMKILNENAKKNQEKLKKKYDIDNIFKEVEQKNKTDNINNKELPIKKVKWYEKLFNFFKKRKNK